MYFHSYRMSIDKLEYPKLHEKITLFIGVTGGSVTPHNEIKQFLGLLFFLALQAKAGKTKLNELLLTFSLSDVCS